MRGKPAARYLRATRRAIESMTVERLLLAEDEARILARAEKLGAALRR